MYDYSKELRGASYKGLIFFVCWIVLLLLALRPAYAFDSFWHMQMGKDLLMHGMSPWIDHYSFTFSGKEIKDVPIIFQVILGLFEIVFGEENVLYSFKVFYISLFLGVLWLYFKEIKAPSIIVLIVLPFIVYFIHIRLFVRPDILSNLLIVICLILYLKAKQSFETKYLISILVLLLFWVNYHTPVFGYIIIFGLFVDKAINKLRGSGDDFSWLNWLAWGVAVFLVGFVNPDGEHFFIAMLKFMGSDFNEYIQEYIPAYHVFNMDTMVYLSWLVSVLLIITSYLKKHYGFVLVLSILLYFSVNTARLVPTVAIISFIILAYFLSDKSLLIKLQSMKPEVKKYISIAGGCMVIFSVYTLISDVVITLKNYENREKIMKQRYPVSVAEYLNKHHEGGNVLNSLKAGGYFVYKLESKYKVYIDGRTNILYPMEFFKHAYKVYTKKINLKEEIEKYNIDYIVYENKPENHSMFKADNDFYLNYADENYLLFTKKEIQGFNYISKLLLYPMCWSDRLKEEINKESVYANVIGLDENLAIKRHLDMLVSYMDRSEIELMGQNLAISAADVDKRLFFYIALNVGGYDKAAESLASIERLGAYDVLMLAYSYAQGGKYLKAEEALSYYLSVFNRDKQLPANISLLFYQILSVVEKNSELNVFTDKYIDGIERSLGLSSGYSYALQAPHKKACDELFK